MGIEYKNILRKHAIGDPSLLARQHGFNEITNEIIVLKADGVTTVRFTSSTLGTGHILVGNGANIAVDTIMSGDLTINSSGVTAIGANKVIVTSMLSTIATASVLGRNSAGTGNVQILTTLPTAMQTNITQLGTITVGVWNGSVISTTYTQAQVISISGVSNRTTVTGTATVPIIDINSSYVGQSSITTLGTITTGTWNGSVVSEIYGGTNQSSYTLGDILYASATNTLSKLAGNTTGTIKYLTQTGTGSVSAAPVWNTLTISPGSSFSVSNLLGTSNQVTITPLGTGVILGSTPITLSLPQSIDTAANVQFNSLGLGVAPSGTMFLYINGTISGGGGAAYGINSTPTFGTSITASPLTSSWTTTSASTISTIYGLHVTNGTKGGSGATITSQYGIFVETQNQATHNYAIYTNIGWNYFGDVVAIGVVPLTDRILYIGGGNIVNTSSATTQYGVFINPLAPTSVSVSWSALYVKGISNHNNITTNAGIYVDSAASNTGTVTNSYGIYINSQALGVTTYGLFIGDCSSDGSAYAIYTGVGPVYIGETVDSFALQVAGGATITKSLTVGTNLTVSSGGATITGNSKFNNNLEIVGNVKIDSVAAIGIGVSGAIAFSIGGSITSSSEQIGISLASAFSGNTTAYSMLVTPTVNAGSTVPNLYGIYIAAPSNAGSVTASYGLYIAAQTVGSTNYAIYTTAGIVAFGDELQLSINNTVYSSVLSTVTNKIKIKVGGTYYYLLADTSNA